MIKKIVFVLTIALLAGLTLNAQNDSTKNEIKTIFGNHKFSNGGYGGLTFGVDNIDGSSAFHSGIRAAWMIGHSFGLGFAASGFSNNWDKYSFSDEDFYCLDGGYGGILLEPVLFPRLPIHLSFPIVLGA